MRNVPVKEIVAYAIDEVPPSWGIDKKIGERINRFLLSPQRLNDIKNIAIKILANKDLI